jgi:hypothetical protein
MRVWTIGDPEPEDHPDVVAGDDRYGFLFGPYHYRWEAPEWDPEWSEWIGGGWWCVEGNCSLVDWEDVLKEEGVVTEDLSDR